MLVSYQHLLHLSPASSNPTPSVVGSCVRLSSGVPDLVSAIVAAHHHHQHQIHLAGETDAWHVQRLHKKNTRREA